MVGPGGHPSSASPAATRSSMPDCATTTPPPKGDLAAALYAELHWCGGAQAVTLILAGATAEQLAKVSEWGERRSSGASDGAARLWLRDGLTTDADGDSIDEDGADFATQGMTAVHVLARDCTEKAALEIAVATSGPEIVDLKAGVEPWGDDSERLPLHYAAQFNPSVDVLLFLLERGDFPILISRVALVNESM